MPYEVDGSEQDAASDGYVHVQRDESEVFSPRAMSSFEGAPVTMGHPEGAVSPENWRQLSVGHAQNIRRDGNHLVADLLITDEEAINAIRNKGWRSTSAGYDAAYETIGRGQMRQRNIVGNHVAILSPAEDARCGDACMIGDSAPRQMITDQMRKQMRRHSRWTQRTMRAIAQQHKAFWQEHSHRG
jgi:hypothetical protein